MGKIHLLGRKMFTMTKQRSRTLRGKYATVNFFPEKNGLTEDTRKRQIIDMAKVFGFSEDKIKKMEDVLARHKKRG